MPEAFQIGDFWRVNSYAYPNPFRPDAREAWTTFCSFYEHDQEPYRSLKAYWESPGAPRKLGSQAVESWKAAFEEFGLLYVISRSNTITVTPAGKQFYDAAEANSREDFVWIGLNLLFRYPLQGPPRGRSRSPAHSDADVLPYRFLHSAMRDLGDYFWWTELERIFCRVFSTSMAGAAVEAVRDLRRNPSRVEDYPLPVDRRAGGFYNSLNQVANHAGMNHLVLEQENEGEHYGPNEIRRRHFFNRHYIPLVSAALGDTTSLTDCGVSATFVDRLPAAPVFTEEQAYFDYLGAAVPSLASAGAVKAPESIAVAGDTVFMLKSGEHFESIFEGDRERVVEGNTLTLCRVARSHRLILSTDLNWTYLVVGKDLVGPTAVRLSLRRARPITDMEPIETHFGGDDA